jgi:hypothetical protein
MVAGLPGVSRLEGCLGPFPKSRPPARELWFFASLACHLWSILSNPLFLGFQNVSKTILHYRDYYTPMELAMRFNIHPLVTYASYVALLNTLSFSQANCPRTPPPPDGEPISVVELVCNSSIDSDISVSGVSFDNSASVESLGCFSSERSKGPTSMCSSVNGTYRSDPSLTYTELFEGLSLQLKTAVAIPFSERVSVLDGQRYKVSLAVRHSLTLGDPWPQQGPGHWCPGL